MDRDRFSRQMVLPWVGERGQGRLARAKVLVAGCGALGSHTASALLRAGVGHLVLVDRDVVEGSNLHRVAELKSADLGRPKAEALADHLGRVYPEAELTVHVAHLGPKEAERIIPEVDLVVDGLDNLESRYLVNEVCVKYKVPWIYTAVLSTYGMTMPILPGEGPCLRCLFPSPPPPGALPTCASAGILGPVPQALAALQAVSAIQILVGSPELSPGNLVYLDLWSRSWSAIQVEQAPGCPTCEKGEYPFLSRPSRAALLCGDAVQVLPTRPGRIDLGALAAKLAPLGRAEVRRGVLVATVEGASLTVFPDGRALIKGVRDPARAQALYDRYIAR
ncbi:MAG: UBA/THIF-type NAD/FAD binding protein [Acetothermia bacterium 64_32]|nr:MAG: UBA/THIF-type NAD/FAD binding protein [Acetothermia bacterium 64_32]HAF69972.1 thiamine biosynthesis protein ThiF [Candidatus Acetothermia bacterium]